MLISPHMFSYRPYNSGRLSSSSQDPDRTGASLSPDVTQGLYMNMKPSDQGGCMLAMHTGIPMFTSKTDHIMSKYRPIAPKPVPKTEGTDQNDSHSLSSISAEKSTTKSTEYRGKRSRKRAMDSKSPRILKKTRPGASVGSMSGKNAGVEGNVEYHPANFNGLTPIFSEQVAPVFGPGGLQRFKDSFDQSQNGISVSLSLSAKSPPRDAYFEEGGTINLNSTMMCNRDGLSFSIAAADHEVLEKDTGFMERAAASTPVYFPSVEISNTQSLKGEFSLACPSVSTSFGGDSEVCSVEDAVESRRGNLVTLSLLPNTPSHVNTRSSSSSSALSVFSPDIRWPSEKQATLNSDLNTSLTMSNKGRWSEEDTSLGGCARESSSPLAACGFVERVFESSQADCVTRVVDKTYLEQGHGGSSEAVMLTDELDRLLWANPAFKRASSERMSSRMQAIGPHIDPLGIRTQLANLMFQPPFPAPKCKAVLWGFLKKFIMQEGGSHSPSTMMDGQAKVIAPQPIRAVGSTINLQRIVCSDSHAAPLAESFEAVKERLDKGVMPSIVTDLKHRVRWANTAYKQMVGQPKCSWLASTVFGSSDEESLAQFRLAGEVSLVCDGAQPPAGVAAFSCRVEIQWSHEGEHSAMSVPSEVVRLDDETAGGMFVWGFDVCHAGVKNLLQIEDTGPFC